MKPTMLNSSMAIVAIALNRTNADDNKMETAEPDDDGAWYKHN